jgi:hypothetical protein
MTGKREGLSIGTRYLLVARATFSTHGFRQCAGDLATSEADAEMKAGAATDTASAIVDVGLCATLEFLIPINLELPTWTAELMSAVKEVLGDAYSESADACAATSCR